MIELLIRNEVNIGQPIRKESSWCRSTIFKLANEECTSHAHTHIFRCWYHCHCVEISPGSNKTKHKNQNKKNYVECMWMNYGFEFILCIFQIFRIIFFLVCGKYEERIAKRKEENDDMKIMILQKERNTHIQNFTVTTGSGLQDAGA